MLKQPHWKVCRDEDFPVAAQMMPLLLYLPTHESPRKPAIRTELHPASYDKWLDI